MSNMDIECYDLWYDATTVGADLVVETWISHSPRGVGCGLRPAAG